MTRFTAYLAVLPAYRQACITVLLQNLGASIELFASPAHLDETVKTAIQRDQYTTVPMRRIAGHAFIQTGHWRQVIASETALLDLNPRSLSAWYLLVVRRLMGRRTLVWGHLHPRDGSASATAGLRRLMRRLASGTVTYTYAQAATAKHELPSQPVWVAPNALYPREVFTPVDPVTPTRDSVLYVGRLEPAKKVDDLISAFAVHAITESSTRLLIVGEGSMRRELELATQSAGLTDRVQFLGHVNDPVELRSIYNGAFASVSPGFVGLGLTQSLGFGVPQIISKNEPHSPEVELAKDDWVTWFDTGDANSFASAISHRYAARTELPLVDAVTHIAMSYSAEAMARGLYEALLGIPSTRGETAHG